MRDAKKTAEKPIVTSTPDVRELLRIIEQKDRLLADQEHCIADRDHLIAEQEKQLRLMEEALRLAQIRRFGAKSEKLPFQGDLFDEAELEVSLSELEAQLADEEPAKKASRKKREGFSDKLPRIQVHLPLSEEEKAGASKTFFTKVKEELDIVPAKAQIIEYWQEKAVFDDAYGGQRIKAAARVAHPLGKCIASVQLLTYILVSKYADGLPLYRLEKMLARYGGNISRTSMANWIIRLDDVFRPLINLLREQQLSGDYLQADETRLQVLKEDGKLATSDKWMWLIRGGPPNQPVVLFEYDPSRSEEVPLRLLDGFEGVLQTDGYVGYNRVCRENSLTRIGCWDHARRKFVEASKATPVKKKGAKVSKADVAIGKIRKLYAIEKRIDDLDPEQKTAKRQALAEPVLDDLKAWMEANQRRVPKDSLTWKAINYTLNQWELLIGYCEDGRLRISNAMAENAIRPFAVGRRAWLFADTSRGAKASATCFSLIETAKANGLEPYDYMHHVIKHIAAADTVEKLEALFPWNVVNSGRPAQGG
ncbi:IS66 family transposase [Sedimenticola hydrogenitrophicus]|uniref:IS66 family transposase n=1 Tax=Sedimenticola hydrogenitrophicus TaxID=2967975 RepID=UPI0023B0B56A|nr:IS66 family transposase [Sedimenticola hydrogenitrophicus]